MVSLRLAIDQPFANQPVANLALARFAAGIGVVAGLLREADRHARQIKGLAQPIDEETLIARGQGVAS